MHPCSINLNITQLSFYYIKSKLMHASTHNQPLFCYNKYNINFGMQFSSKFYFDEREFKSLDCNNLLECPIFELPGIQVSSTKCSFRAESTNLFWAHVEFGPYLSCVPGVGWHWGQYWFLLLILVHSSYQSKIPNLYNVVHCEKDIGRLRNRWKEKVCK